MTDFSFEVAMMKDIFVQECCSVSYELMRPSLLHKPKLYRDGNMWCALLGEDLQSGVCGFGESPEKAMISFDKSWHTDITEGLGIPNE